MTSTTPPDSIVERLLESPTGGFGIETLSPCQRARARIYRGVALGDLADRADVRRMLGGADPATLPSTPPTEIVDLAGIRTLKTITAAAVCIAATQTVSVQGVLTGETPRVTWLSVTTQMAQAGFQVLVGTLMSRRALRSLVIGEPTANSVTLRHPSGCPVEIVVAPMARAGALLVARWSAGMVIDEAPRVQSAEDGYVVSLEEQRTAVRGRLLPGAQLLYIGSPWAPEGWCYQQFNDRFGRPGQDLVVLRAPAPDLNPVWWTPQRIAEVRAASPRTAKMDIDAEFGATETSAYELDDIAASANERIVKEHLRSSVVIACDPSKLLGKDRWGITVCYWVKPKPGRHEVLVDPVQHGLPAGTYLGPARGPMGEPLFYDIDGTPFLLVAHAEVMPDGATIEDVKRVLTALASSYQAELAVFDYGGDTSTLIGHFQSIGVRTHAFPWSPTQRRAGYQLLGRLLADRMIHITQTEVRDDLSRVKAVLAPNGQVNYTVPRSAKGHADLASCLVSYCIAENEQLVYDSPVSGVTGGRHIAPGR